MGQKIYPLGFQPQYFQKNSSLVFIKNRDFKDRFFSELELQRLLKKLFLLTPSLLQKIKIEQSLKLGYIINISAFSLFSRKLAPFKKKTGKAKNLKFFLRLKRLSFRSRLSTRRFNSVISSHMFQKNFLFVSQPFLNSFSRMPVQFFINYPAIAFFRSPQFFSAYSSFLRFFYRFRSIKFFASHVFIAFLVFYSRDWVSLTTQLVVASFFRTRQHRNLFNFFSRLFSLGFKRYAATPFCTGFTFRMNGRFDKKKRAQKFVVFDGSLKRQQLNGSLEPKLRHTITKNGVFSVFLCLRWRNC